MMLFIVPLKAATSIESESKLTKLFERTVRSICNQTSQNFIVVVACNRIPDIQYKHKNIHYLVVDFEPKSTFKGWIDFAKETDKAKRIIAALEYAAEFTPHHVMVVDADDCVNSKLAEFASKNPGSSGWYFASGYIYLEGRKFIINKKSEFNRVCGSCLIVRTDLLRDLISQRREKYLYFKHNSISVNGQEFSQLPFVGSVYSVDNGENSHMTPERKGQLVTNSRYRSFSVISKRLKLYRVQWLSGRIRRKFGLYKIELS